MGHAFSGRRAAPPVPQGNTRTELSCIQDSWAERLLDDAHLSDAVAIVGPEQQRVQFVGALLANVSEPLRKALYGKFREGQTREIVLSAIKPAAFRAILRMAAHLNPSLEPESVIPTMQAAVMYMIGEVTDECTRYIKHIPDEDIVTVLSSSAILGYPLPEDVERAYWCRILLNADNVLDAPSFSLLAHGSIIIKLLKLEEFGVSEEQLWSRILDWAKNAVQKPELLGPLSDALPEGSASKRLKLDAPAAGTNEAVQQTIVLQQLTKHIRFLSMGKQYFCEKVRPWLTREDSESVFMFHLLNKAPSNQSISPRSGLNPPERPQLISILSKHNPEQAQGLPAGTTEWKITDAYGPQSLQVEMKAPTVVTKVHLIAGNTGVIWQNWSVRAPRAPLPGQFTNNGRMMLFQVDKKHTQPTTRLHIITPEPRFQTQRPKWAALVKVEVFGKVPRDAFAAEIVDSKFAELRTSSS